MSLYTSINLLLHIHLVSLVGLQIIWIRLLVKMPRGNSSEKAKTYNIAHIPAKEEEGKRTNRFFQAFLTGRYRRGEFPTKNVELQF